MTTLAVLCTGPSLSPAVAESVRHLQTVAVNTVGLDVINSVTGEVVPAIAPWATALAANDVAFWVAFPQAREFAGRRFSANRIKGVERIEGVSSGHCSGVLALEVAKQLGATRILLLGCDMHGTHYFGPYAHQKLKNTTDPRRKIHMQQFAQWGKRNPGIEVINCTPGSAIAAFPMGSLDEFLRS
jgi:hypothetical protein